MNDPLLKTGTPFHRKEVVVIGVMTFVLFVLKSLWALSQASDPFIPDELVYKFNARSLFDLTKYYSARYPPVYPLALAPAFLFKNWFDIMLVLNAFWSSLTVPASWFLARAAGLRHPLIAAGLCALIPMHGIYPNIFFSENLFLPLFVFCAALALRGKEAGAGEGLVFGLALGLTHLTKYIFLPALPLFMGLWILKRAGSGQKTAGIYSLKRWVPEVNMFLGYGLLLFLWMVYGWFSGFTMSELFGFGISGIKTNAGTFQSLWMWGVAYFLFVLLVWFPLWGILLLWLTGMPGSGDRDTVNPAERSFFVLLFLLVSLFFLLCVQHSFGQPYNYPVPNRLMGRYLMPFFPFMLIAGLRVLEKYDETGRRILAGRAFFGIALLTAAAFLSRWVLFGKGIWSFQSNFVNRIPGNVDVLAYVPTPFFLFSVLTLLILLILLIFRKTKIVFTVCPLVFLMVVFLIKEALIFKEYPRRLSYRNLFSVLALPDKKQEPVWLYSFRGEDSSLTRLDSSFRFWEVDAGKIRKEVVSPRELIARAPFGNSSFLLTVSHLDLPLFREFKQNDQTFFLYRIDGLASQTFQSNLLPADKGNI